MSYHGIGKVYGWNAAELWHLHCINHTHIYVVYKLHLHNSSIVSQTGERVQYAALAYSTQPPPPPTAKEIEGGPTGRKGFLKLQNNFQYRHSPDRIDKIDKKNVHRYSLLCYLILESKPPQQPSSGGYIMLGIKKVPTCSAFPEQVGFKQLKVLQHCKLDLILINW